METNKQTGWKVKILAQPRSEHLDVDVLLLRRPAGTLLVPLDSSGSRQQLPETGARARTATASSTNPPCSSARKLHCSCRTATPTPGTCSLLHPGVTAHTMPEFFITFLSTILGLSSLFFCSSGPIVYLTIRFIFVIYSCLMPLKYTAGNAIN